jgi:hypothetical protein
MSKIILIFCGLFAILLSLFAFTTMFYEAWSLLEILKVLWILALGLVLILKS